MVECVACKEELDEAAGIYVSEHYISRHGIKVERSVGFYSPRSLSFVHHGCVESVDVLDEQEFRKWMWLTQEQQRENVASVQRSLNRIENAILALPEEMTAVFRDELEHERRTYGEGG